jgi:phosphoglycolate phosphatase
MSVDTVLFDLDGTLVDTAPDLVAVLNRLLRETGRPPAPFAVARNEVSNGAVGLIRVGFGADTPPAEIESLRARFLDIYARQVCIESCIFNGSQNIIDFRSDYSWGIVTNKPHLMTVPLLEALGLAAAARCIVSGDRLPQRKPHPAPLLLADDEVGVPAARCVYVGDAPRDIEAGRAAGMRTIAAAYGYIRPGTDVHAWGADRVVSHPSDIAAAIAALPSARAHDAA